MKMKVSIVINSVANTKYVVLKLLLIYKWVVINHGIMKNSNSISTFFL